MKTAWNHGFAYAKWLAEEGDVTLPTEELDMFTMRGARRMAAPGDTIQKTARPDGVKVYHILNPNGQTRCVNGLST